MLQFNVMMATTRLKVLFHAQYVLLDMLALQVLYHLISAQLVHTLQTKVTRSASPAPKVIIVIRLRPIL